MPSYVTFDDLDEIVTMEDAVIIGVQHETAGIFYWAKTTLLRIAQYAGGTWHSIGEAGEIAFQNSWVNLGGAYEVARWNISKAGIVRLQGAVKNGTVNAAIFTLPVGCRPSGSVRFAVVLSNVFGYVDVTSAGEVILRAGSNAAVFLDGISFKVA